MPNVSTGLLEQRRAKEKRFGNPYYQGDLAESYNFYIERAESARVQRERVYTEFDDLQYERDYMLNEQARNSYLRKKRNDDEVRINTGTTEKKIETVQNELLAMNLQPEILAFDEHDNEIVELGRDMADIVRRTNEIERDEDFWIDAIQELLSQRSVFVEEIWIDKTVKDKRRRRREENIFESDILDLNSTYRIQRPEKRLLSGLQMYLGDVSLPAYRYQEQPYLVKYNRRIFDEARAIYGTWSEWDKVKPGRGIDTWYDGVFKWRFMSNLQDNEVEELHYISYPDDEYQIILNGVMMLKPGTPVPWEHEGYSSTMVGLKPLSRTFAYSKPLTASAKTLQALDNETIRLLIRKFRQALEPPMGTKEGKIYSKDIWAAGAITQGVKKGTFEKLIDHTGVTNSEMEMYKLIGNKTEEFIGASDVLQGISQDKKTAREVLNQQRQGIKQLGHAVLATMRLKRELTYLRLYNILQNYTPPVRRRVNPLTQKIEDVYRKFTIMDAEFENGKMGKKIVQFMDRDLVPEEEDAIFRFSKQQERAGKPIRIKTLNVKRLREIRTTWFVAVNQREKEGSELQKIMFQDKIGQAVQIAQIAGRPLNGDKIIDDFERTWQTRDLFQRQAPVNPTAALPGEEAVDPKEAEQLLKQIDALGKESPAGQDVRNATRRPQRPSLTQVTEPASAA